MQLTPPATEEELLEAYHRSGLHRLGVSFMAAKNNSARMATLELGVLMARQPNKYRRIDHKALQAGNDN
jgi:hypothetical protein